MLSLHNTVNVRPDVNISEIKDVDLFEVFGEYSNTLKEKYIKDDGTINSKGIFENSVYKSCLGFEDKLEKYFGKEYFREVLYCLLKDIQFIPRCPICHNLNYLRDWVKGFQDFCCRNCINRYQTSDEWKENVIKHSVSIRTAKNVNSNHYFNMLGIKNYRKDPNNPNFFLVDNYCNHSDVLRIGYTQLVRFTKNGRATLCKECNEEIYNTYYPTKEDVNNFKKEFKEFVKDKNGLTTDGWKFYYPRELKIIDVCCEIIGNIDRSASIVDKLNFLSEKFFNQKYSVNSRMKEVVETETQHKIVASEIKPSVRNTSFLTMQDIYKASNGDARTVISYLKQEENYKILISETPNIDANVPRSPRYYCWLHKLNDVPKCPYCGRPAAWFDMQHGFRSTCCSEDCLRAERNSKKTDSKVSKKPLFANIKDLWGNAAHNDAKSMMLFLRNEEYNKMLISETSSFSENEDMSKSERFYCWLNNLTERPKCPYCGKERRFRGFYEGYFPTCGSKECRSKGISEANRSSNRDYVAQAQKAKETYKKRTGYEHNMQNPEFKNKFFEDYAKTHNGEKCGVCSQKAIENRKKTFDEKYGGDLRMALVMGAIQKYGSLSEMASVAQNNRYADYVHNSEIVIPADELLDVYLESYHNNEMSNRSLIMTIKSNRELIDEVVKRTSFLDEYNPDDVVERIYYLAKELTEVVYCKYCVNKATWKYRGILGGYREVCSCSECHSKKLSDIHTGMNLVSENRIEEFIKWQNNVTEVNDEAIITHLKYDTLLQYVTNTIILEYLDNRFSDSDSYEETLARIEMGIEEKPKCALPGCNNPVKWIGRQRALYTSHCCVAHSAQDSVTKEKCIQTNIEHWGTRSPYDSSIYQQKVFEEYGVYYHNQRSDVMDKIEKTRRSLKMSGTSKEEQELYRILKEDIGLEIIEQYHSDVYPYSCDIYIPKWDLYIEYQGSHYHMNKPYTGSPDDLSVVEELQRKDKLKQEELGYEYYTQYAAMIKVWTILDPKKRKWAKDNNLNFLEIFKYKDADDVRRQIEDYLKSRNINIDECVVSIDTSTNVLF